MSNETRLAALLRDLPPPPPVPVDLTARVLAAAAAAPQEPRPVRARRSVRRDRRGPWLRRPLLAGTAALTLIVTSAVAATLAGVPIPQRIVAALFPEKKASEPKQDVAPRRAARSTPAAAAPTRMAEVKPVPDTALWAERPNLWRRLLMAERIITARRAMGLPTRRADRLERHLQRRAELWRSATPEQRAQWLERQRARRAARRATLATAEGQAALAARREQRRAWRGQREAGIPLTREQRAARRELIREWGARRRAEIPALAEAQRAARREQLRAWREARRARNQVENGSAEGEMVTATEGPDAAGR